MNTALVLQPEDVARLLEIEKLMQALSREREAILTKAARAECEEPEHTPNFSMFKYKTQLLLAELWDAHNRVLSQHDIREYVIGDEDASDVAVRLVISRARKEMKTFPDCRYEIINSCGKGYRLVCKESFQSVSNHKKTRKKRYKKHETI